MAEHFSRDELNEVIKSAKRLNVELNEEEAIKWLNAIQKAADEGDKITFDDRTGVFGQNIAIWMFPEKLKQLWLYPVHLHNLSFSVILAIVIILNA